MCLCMCIETPDQSRGSRSRINFWAAPCRADAGIAECCSSSKTFAARLLREPSSVDYQASVESSVEGIELHDRHQEAAYSVKVPVKDAVTVPSNAAGYVDDGGDGDDDRT